MQQCAALTRDCGRVTREQSQISCLGIMESPKAASFRAPKHHSCTRTHLLNDNGLPVQALNNGGRTTNGTLILLNMTRKFRPKNAIGAEFQSICLANGLIFIEAHAFELIDTNGIYQPPNIFLCGKPAEHKSPKTLNAINIRSQFKSVPRPHDLADKFDFYTSER